MCVAPSCVLHVHVWVGFYVRVWYPLVCHVWKHALADVKKPLQL